VPSTLCAGAFIRPSPPALSPARFPRAGVTLDALPESGRGEGASFPALRLQEAHQPQTPRRKASLVARGCSPALPLLSCPPSGEAQNRGIPPTERANGIGCTCLPRAVIQRLYGRNSVGIRVSSEQSVPDLRPRLAARRFRKRDQSQKLRALCFGIFLVSSTHLITFFARQVTA
jgi:hypothetical protein